MSDAKDVSEIIKIVDDEIDVDAIMAEIRAKLASRPKLEPDPSRFSFMHREGSGSELDWAVEEAGEAARDLSIGDQLQPGHGVVGGLATRLRRPLHQLARFYVEILAVRQAAVNRPLVRAVELLAEENARLRAELDELKREKANPSP